MKKNNKGAGEEAFQKIIHLVLSHGLQPGDRIYETNLVETFEMSRTPIREALSRLASMGFLEKPWKQKGYKVPLLSPDDMKEIFYTRMVLEGKAARRAAKLVDEKGKKRLQNINYQEENTYYANQKDIYASLNESFHMIVAELSENQYLQRYIQQLFWRSNLYIFFFMRFYNVQNVENLKNSEERLSYLEHRKVVDAIIAGESESAEKAMQEHLLIAYYSMLNPGKKPDINISEHEFDLGWE